MMVLEVMPYFLNGKYECQAQLLYGRVPCLGTYQSSVEVVKDVFLPSFIFLGQREFSRAIIYSTKGLPLIGLDRTGGFVKYAFFEGMLAILVPFE